MLVDEIWRKTVTSSVCPAYTSVSLSTGIKHYLYLFKIGN